MLGTEQPRPTPSLGEQYYNHCSADAAGTPHPTIWRGYEGPVTYNGIRADTVTAERAVTYRTVMERR